MKKILCLVLLCMLPITLAELELDEIKVYINEDRYYDADEGGGDIDVERGDILKLKVYLENNMSNTTEVRLKGVIELIDDGEDLTEEKDWYGISEHKTKWGTLEFDIPYDSPRDDYDLELFIYYQYSNEIVEEIKVEWDVIVEVEDEDKNDIETSLDELKTKRDNINSSGKKV